MKLNYLLLLISFTISHFTFSQSINNLINQVSEQGIVQMVRDLSGEDSTLVSGNNVLIEHRVSSIGNNLSADYINERLISYGLNVSTINYSSTGRNIVATQIGTINPNNIYIISAHYDAVANYGADDNASGATAILESARILSNYKFENTIIYALWDEEEEGLIGATDYAINAAFNDENILAVLNIDMIGYDGDGDRLFDINVRNEAASFQIKNDLINIVSSYNLDLLSNVVDPGTSNSDHAAFWMVGYSSALLGEAWSTNDVTPGYHSDSDRINLFDISYFHNMVKLCVGYISTKGVLINSLGLNSFDLLHSTIYPNPTSGKINIEFGGLIKGELTVLSINGEIVIQQKIQGKQVEIKNFENLASGIYIFRIIDNKGNTSNLKVVKE
tara:strand:+ start:201 stop:1364 length:1164 start_codon:yes stop_codon:yes gene_type:complete